MIKSEVMEQPKTDNKSNKPAAFYSIEDIAKVIELFSILINIDKKRRVKEIK